MGIIEEWFIRRRTPKVPSNGLVKNNGRAPGPWWQRPLLGVGLVAVLTALFFFPYDKSLDFSDWEVGKPAREEVIADFTFPILKSELELKLEREAARESIPPVLRFDETLTERKLAELDSFFSAIEWVATTGASDSALGKVIRDWGLQLSPETTALLVSQIRQKSKAMRGGASKQSRVRQKGRPIDLRDITKGAVSECLQKGIIADRSEVVKQAFQGKVTMISGGKEKVLPLEQLYDLNMAREKLLDRLVTRFPNQTDLVKAVYEVGVFFLAPNLTFDQEETLARRTRMAEAVPSIKGYVLKDERIIDRHEIVTPHHKDVLRSYAIAKVKRPLQGPPWRLFGSILGWVGMTILLLGMLAMFLRTYRPKIYSQTSFLLMLGIIITIPLLVASFLAGHLSLSEYLIPVALTSILVTVLLDAHTGIISTVIVALLVGVMRGYGLSFSLISIICGMVAAFSVRKVQRRSQFYRSLLYVPLAYAVSIFVLSLLRFTPFEEMIREVGAGVANGFLAPTLAIGLLPIFEALFNVTTDISLLELSDLNRPLLKKLALRAPGTFHHSIVVGNLAEAAAEAVGANSLLTRVGAYYHDIGKMEKPSYFVENQRGESRHEKLTPRMSSLVLASHVRDGCELAERERLPQVIQDIIRQHHGTGLMTYFYQKALDMAEDGKVEEANFRYPGPKPQTKEAGIVMLADAVEAAARTLPDPSPSRLKGLIHKIIENKFREGELDECELTLRDLTKIAESFLPILIGVFHPRIEYPEREEVPVQVKEKKVV